MQRAACEVCGRAPRPWEGELSLSSFAALVGRPVALVKSWLEAGALPGRLTRRGRWRVAAATVRAAELGELALPDGSNVAPAGGRSAQHVP
jgi:hypothetical protein